jgi:hypothetical protein
MIMPVLAQDKPINAVNLKMSPVSPPAYRASKFRNIAPAVKPAIAPIVLDRNLIFFAATDRMFSLFKRISWFR